MNFIILGPPGTGKGTIAKFIEVKFGPAHISTGDLLRNEVAGKTEIGQKVEPIMNEGKFVSDEIVLEILKKKLISLNGKSFVLDGFPRNLKQGQMLKELLNELGIKIGHVLLIHSDDNVIVHRLSSRRQCISCRRIYGADIPSKKGDLCEDCDSQIILREDDKPEVVKYRLQLYHERTSPLIAFYKDEGLLVEINGNRTLPEIFSEMEVMLKKMGA